MIAKCNFLAQESWQDLPHQQAWSHCLLEADFYRWLKVVFAKHMVCQMHVNGVISIEQGVVVCKTPIDRMPKHFFFDQAHVLHIICAESSTNATNDYDAVNHVIGSFALQAVHVSINFVWHHVLCCSWCISF